MVQLKNPTLLLSQAKTNPKAIMRIIDQGEVFQFGNGIRMNGLHTNIVVQDIDILDDVFICSGNFIDPEYAIAIHQETALHPIGSAIRGKRTMPTNSLLPMSIKKF